MPANVSTGLLGALPEAAELARLDAAGRLARLGSRGEGLTAAEAAARLGNFGPNEPVRQQRASVLQLFLSNFVHTLALLLWFAAGLAFAGGASELGSAIVAVVVVNGIFAFVQEHRAEQVVQGLMRRVAIRAVVRRGGREERVAALDLAPGDVVRIAAGDICPADGALLAAEDLTLDLSMLTGESLPQERSAAAETVPEKGATLFDLASMVPAGAAIVTGSGEMVVSATGPASALGEIASLVETVGRQESVLQQQVRQLSRTTAVIAVVAGSVTLMLAQAFTDTGFVAALTFATGVIVALVPEGLLPTLSVSLAIGARRMATRGAAARRLSAVEVVGSVTVICTDKTGTLTENAVEVLGIDADSRAGGEERLAKAAVLCNDARLTPDGPEGDALDVALLKWAEGRGLDTEAIRARYPRIEEVSFDARRRYMSVTCGNSTDRTLFIKGAPEAVLALCSTQPSEKVTSALDEATSRGERVLLFASGGDDGPVSVLGLARFHDPPREGVKEAVSACRGAGVRIVMLTGDHPATARALADRIGLGHDLPLVLGSDLDGMDDRALGRVVGRDSIFARIDPAQKLRIVQVLEKAGEIVVVTGDGINDAPALRAAGVGIAMGRRGTDVAKQAADIVLSDDNFTTIVAAIEEGRSIKANIRRFVSYVFTSNVAELAPFLLYVFLPVPLPLAIIQILAIDLGTDLLPALALGTEPPAPRSMSVGPEPPHAPLLTRALFWRTFVIYGLAESLLGLGAFFGYYLAHGWRPFESMDESMLSGASTLTFLGIVSGQVGCLFASRDGSMRQRLSLRSNWWVGWGLAFELGLTLALLYVPGLNDVFSMSPVSPLWLGVLPLGAAAFLALDQVRRVVQRDAWGTR